MREIRNFLNNMIHTEGHSIIFIHIIAILVLFSISSPLGWIAVVLLPWVLYFFRNPKRVLPDGKNIIVSPADGLVQSIKEVKPPEELDIKEKMTRISIFLTVFDVHVAHAPFSGKVQKLVYNTGKFFNAALDKASIHNERQSVVLVNDDGSEIPVVLIAGLIARRIVCDLSQGDDVNIGDKFAIIKFGSRVDIYLPKEYQINVKEGQYMIGSETIIARW